MPHHVHYSSFMMKKSVTTGEKQWMYVEYEEPVLQHIDKIYLSPGSAKYQDFFRILLDQKEDDEPDKKEDENESKVRISQNPFRNKE